jgi:phage I-like protein
MNSTQFFSASHAIALPASADAVAPSSIHLIPAGAFVGRDGRGPYVLDADAVLTAFGEAGAALPLDYEHQSMHTLENGQPAPAAGWLVALEAREDGIWGKVDWTARGAAFVSAHEYKYVSPVFDYLPDAANSAGGRVFRLAGAALTNSPNLHLTALNRREAFSTHPQGDFAVAIPEDILNSLRYALNLPALATIEDLKAELDKLQALLATPETVAMRQTLALPEAAGVAEIITAAHARIGAAAAAAIDPSQYVPKSEYERVAHALKTEQDRIEGERVEREVTAAMAAKKVAPANAEWARAYCRRDADGFAQFVAQAPALLPDGAQTAHTRNPPPAAAEKNPLLADAEARAASGFR